MATLAGTYLALGGGTAPRMTGKSGVVATPSAVGAGVWMYQKVALDTGSGSYYSWVTPNIDAQPDIAAPIGPWDFIAVQGKWLVGA